MSKILGILVFAAIFAAAWLGGYLPWSPEEVPPPPTPAAPVESKQEKPPEYLEVLQAPKPQLQNPLDALPEDDRRAFNLLMAHFNVGDFGKALHLAETNLKELARSAAYRTWVLAQMPVILASVGWMSLKTGDCDSAIDYFRRASDMSKKSLPEVRLGLGVCFQRQHNWQRAEEELKAYLKGNKKDAGAWLLYADIHESMMQFKNAESALEAAKELVPDEQKKALNEKLAAMRRKGSFSDYQFTQEGRHFILTYDTKLPDGLPDRVLGILEDGLNELMDSYGARTLSYPIEVLLYSSADFNGLVSGLPHWAGGVFDGRIRIPIGGWSNAANQWETLRTTLRHELVHAVLSEMSERRALPTWFEEGLANRFAYAANGPIGPFLFPPTPGNFLGPAAFTGSFLAQDKMHAGLLYAQSLYLVLCLERRVDERAIPLILEGVTAQSAVDSTSLLAPLGIDFPSLVTMAGRFWANKDPL